ncbi:peptide-methionine (R)-S-oxide reductase MsrB [Pararobbsia silviterrae]|uniref:peptide-methionine (R)-S-oxide reductase n=1 Tax=Pararobbsia silviterrae TaxID=1792498 RepID=A0A494YAC5_9BURK|nr:peptide-methionine (R)-S-oxide reductase MsrB [Pararobbsia silviterrae]RKP57585.1 peptide-methionine (R)-S-oxide reductase [Pararobbsia silviterrae]
MNTRRRLFVSGGSALAVAAALTRWRAFAATPGDAAAAPPPAAGTASGPAEHFEVVHTDAEWRKLLTPAQYDVLRNAGTERPFTSPLNDEHRAGAFACAACALKLFDARTKFDSGTGWPSFYAPLEHAVATHADLSFGMIRTEVHCRRCGGHLGHLFDDGPKPTGLRYCMNGVAMTFTPSAT